MKLCSQCQFIYEDEQERCDMDGAELVYEPTLENAFPRNVQDAGVEYSQAESRKIIIPLSAALEKPAVTIPSIASSRSRLPLQIAAGLLTAVFAFAGYYGTRRALSHAEQPAPTIVKTQDSKSFSSLMASGSAMTTETSASQKSEPESSSSATKLETQPVGSDSAVPPLPGLKPLPRLKPLPTLKPIPKLAEQNRSLTANRKGVIVTTKTSNDSKKESRLGSFLKKTGRVLTKPFKS